ncbi:MAG: lamin tail domain-containing protein [Verrucomicrobiota bacterium]
MTIFRLVRILIAAASVAASALVAHAQLFITEWHSAGSSNANGYSVDWFELTNTGSSAVTLTNWRMDDSSPSFATGAVLSGVTSLAAGKSAIFLEVPSAGTPSFATIQAGFLTAWFGSNVPSGLLIGSVIDGGIGLSGNGDAVNIYDAAQSLMASVSFGSNAGNLNRTFDNTALLNNTAVNTFSSVGVNGAFLSANGLEIGSPGIFAPIPEPSTYAAIAGLATLGTVVLRRRFRNVV